MPKWRNWDRPSKTKTKKGPGTLPYGYRDWYEFLNGNMPSGFSRHNECRRGQHSHYYDDELLVDGGCRLLRCESPSGELAVYDGQG